jgi:NADP-dependent 3-hydroxy acid dehydrogenase YdfG
MSTVPRVLVTGASSGIGREMARQLGARGYRVALTGRREQELREAARQVKAEGGEALPLIGSVTDREVVARHYATIRERWGRLDWAILNAGVGDSVDARRFSAERYHRLFAVNVLGVVNWLEAVLPDMIEAGSGTVAGISSLSPLMRHVIRHLPAAVYDALVGRMAGRRPEGATRAGDGRG